MFELKDLLKKFSFLIDDKENQIILIQKIISDVLNIKIEKDNIKIENNLVFLKTKPIYKNEILINKEKILLLLKNNTNKNYININFY